jgi:hypothetical protein
MFPSQAWLLFGQESPRKNKWTTAEDNQLRQAVQSFGTNSWNQVALMVPSRNGKQCRERWLDHISPNVLKDFWLPDEDALLLREHALTGNKWTAIASQLPGRSALGVKNRWNWLIRHPTVGALKPSNDVPEVQESQKEDVAEKPKPSQLLFDRLNLEDGLFGIDFRKFQVQMLSGHYSVTQ